MLQMLKNRYEDLVEFLEVLFLSDLRDFIDSGKIKELRRFEVELFFNYFTRFSPFFINRERKGLDYSKNNFFYGEIPYRVLSEICRIISVSKNDVIYDLGCGRGKILFYCRIANNCRCCMGYDLITTYVETSVKIAEKLKLDRIHFFCRDIADADLTAAGVVFVHGPTFSKKLHNVIYQKICSLKPESRFVSVSVAYNHPALELIAKKSFLLSWGKAIVYCYKRNNMTFTEYSACDEEFHSFQ